MLGESAHIVFWECDEFLHKIQQEKMQELWDNAEDGEWENA